MLSNSRQADLEHSMDPSMAITIDYWAIQEGKDKLWQLSGIEEFKDEISQSYISRVHGRPGDLGGGLYEFAIKIITNLTLTDFVGLVASGIAFDLLKSGTKLFILRPLLCAYDKLKAKNTDRNLDISEIKFIFRDTEIVVSKICNDSIYNSLGEIFRKIADNYEHLQNKTEEYPYSIQIPVFEDPEKRICRFRVLLEFDEPISNVKPIDYFGYWGLYYDYERTFRIFDVKRQLLIDSEFLTANRYWEAYEQASKG